MIADEINLENVQALANNDASSKSVAPAGRWYGGRSFQLALLSSALLWLSFPPVGLWPLAWVAPVPLIRACLDRRLDGPRPYFAFWVAGFAYWLATLYFVPLPHWALVFGWLLISFYLAFYTVLFVTVARAMINMTRIPAVIAIPLCWTSIEWVRCNAITGFGMACLAHTQYRQTLWIQVADLFGAYTLTLSLCLFATCVALLPIMKGTKPGRESWSYGLLGIAILAAVAGYGKLQLNSEHTLADRNQLVIGLIQGSVDTQLTDREGVAQRKFEQYCGLTIDARRKWNDLDLLVWPEGTFPAYDLHPDSDLSRLDPRGVAQARDDIRSVWHLGTGYPEVFDHPLPLLGGGASVNPTENQVYNSAFVIGEQGTVTDRYFKIHRVMYGEYFPVLNWFPIFNQMLRGIHAGHEFKTIELNGIRLAPNICFETTVPHFVRRQVLQLRARGEEPDALLNVTNDGWFFGTSCLDLHLACNVFRAVENHKPNLVCANTGFSAEIDRHGSIQQMGPRRDVQAIRATVRPDRGSSLYQSVGDWPWIIAAAWCGVVWVLSMIVAKRRRP